MFSHILFDFILQLEERLRLEREELERKQEEERENEQREQAQEVSYNNSEGR